MPQNNGRYYLGRIKKAGRLDSVSLLEAILTPQPITVGKFDWTFTDVVRGSSIDEKGNPFEFVFGHLSKYKSKGQIKVIKLDAKLQAETPISDLLIASSPFVYIPSVSGVSYLHVWNEIQSEIFPKRFADIIVKFFDDFFVDFAIEPISDYRVFSKKIRELDTIDEIRAKVHPPNPLFGRHWKLLERYVRTRNASEFMVNETSKGGDGLRSKLVDLMSSPNPTTDGGANEDVDITDAAFLMAADGYGHGKVVGTKREKRVTLRTSDTQENFEFTKDPQPEELARESINQFHRVSNERQLGHE